MHAKGLLCHNSSTIAATITCAPRRSRRACRCGCTTSWRWCRRRIPSWSGKMRRCGRGRRNWKWPSRSYRPRWRKPERWDVLHQTPTFSPNCVSTVVAGASLDGATSCSITLRVFLFQRDVWKRLKNNICIFIFFKNSAGEDVLVWILELVIFFFGRKTWETAQIRIMYL